MYRAISICLALVLFVSFAVAGCGSKEETPKAPTTPTAVKGAAEKAAPAAEMPSTASEVPAPAE
jgi:hypothetical protein